jgi:hypothetical protein
LFWSSPIHDAQRCTVNSKLLPTLSLTSATQAIILSSSIQEIQMLVVATRFVFMISISFTTFRSPAIKISQRSRKPAGLVLQWQWQNVHPLLESLHVVVHLLEASIACDATLCSKASTKEEHQTQHMDVHKGQDTHALTALRPRGSLRVTGTASPGSSPSRWARTRQRASVRTQFQH